MAACSRAPPANARPLVYNAPRPPGSCALLFHSTANTASSKPPRGLLALRVSNIIDLLIVRCTDNQKVTASSPHSSGRVAVQQETRVNRTRGFRGHREGRRLLLRACSPREL